MLHMSAYYYPTLLAADGLRALPPVNDTIFATSGNGLLMPTDLKLVAAYAGSTQMQRARVNAPSMLRVGFPSIRPVSQSAASGAAPADPNFMLMVNNPLAVKANEPVGVDGQSALSATGERAFGLLWFADKIDPVPQGEVFTLRFTSMLTVVTGTDGTWIPITPTFDQALPSGTYACTGFELTGTGAVAARMILPGSLYRPGVIAQQGAASAASAGATRTAQCFYDGSLGVFGVFQTSAPPSIEALFTENTLANSVEGYIRVIRIGEVGMAPPVSTGSYLATSSSSSLTRR